MTIDQLTWVLFWISIVTAILFAGLVGFYFWYSRRHSNNYLENRDFDLRYFIQKQVDYHGRVTGYECLLRQRQADGSWRLPKDLGSLPLQRVVFMLEDTFKSLPTEPITLSINLEYEQIVSPEFRYFVRWALAKIEPMKLAVEYTARRPTQGYQKPLFLRRIHEARQYGMHFDIDNVGADLDNLRNIEWLLDEVDTLKCSMRVFRKTDPHEWLDLNLQFWNRLSQQRHLNLVLMGIENEADERLAEQLKIRLRQGYRFGRPVNPKIPPKATVAKPVTEKPVLPPEQRDVDQQRQQLYTDDYFAKGHWGRKLWQTFIAILGWLAVVIPCGVTVTAFLGAYDPRIWHLWSYGEGIFEIKFIGVILLFAFVMASVFAVSMTIIQNRKRERLVEQWPTFNPINQRKRKNVLDEFMDERFGPAEFRENVRSYQVQPEQNLDTDQIHDLYAKRDLNDLDKE